MKREIIKKIKQQDLAIFLLVAIFLLLARFAYPLTSLISATPLKFLATCKFKEHTNLPCMTCGGTRAVYYFMTGEFIEALRFSTGACLLIIYLLFLLLKRVYFFIFGLNRDLLAKHDKYILLIIISSFFIQWIYKLLITMSSS